MSTDRRTFLGAIVAAVPAARLAGGQNPQAVARKSPWDVAWTDKLAGRKHRAVFDAPEISQGLAPLRTLVWIRDYGEVYGAQPQEMGAVLVLRHNAIWMVMSDAFWMRRGVGEITGIKDPRTGRPIGRNPFLGPNIYPDLPSALMDSILPKAVQASTAVLACNLAFQDVVEHVKRTMKLEEAAARKYAVEAMVPGIALQPSGVFAVTRAQEAGCQYMLAS